MIDLGTIRPGSTIRIPFNSFDKDDGSSITMTNFAAADILVYKDGSTTERASTAGYTATTDFDAKTGKHLVIIDLADNTTAGFYSAGSEYLVAVDAVTIDAVTTGGWIARFRIGYPNAIMSTTINTVTTQTSFTLVNGPAEDNALTGMWAIVHDVASNVQVSWVVISGYTGSTKTVTLAAAPTFTIAATDNFSIMYPAPMQSTVMGRTLDVSSTGEAGLDWANIGSPTTAQSLSGTSTKALEPTTAGRTLDVAATGEAGLDFNNILSSSLVTLHSLTVTGATTLTGIVTATNASNSIVGCGLTTATINATADQVWDEVLSGHLTAGTTGNALNAAGSAGDPWSTALPGAYGTGTAGLIVGTTIQNAVAASAIRAAVGLASANLDTQIAAVQADTDNIQTRLPAALVSGRMDSSVGAMAANVLTASALATDAVDEIVDQVWNEVHGGHLTAGTTGESLSIASTKSTAAYDQAVIITTYLTTYVQPDLDDIQTRLPAALVGGRMDSSVGAMAANVITAAATAADYLAEINAEVVDVINVDTLVAGVTVSQALRRIGALTSGIVTGAGTGTETFKDYAQSVNTIVITVDSSGNRSAITYN